MKRNLVLLLTCLFGLSAFAQEDPVLMRIKGKILLVPNLNISIIKTIL